MLRLTSLISRETFSHAELSCLALDGELYPIGGSFIPVDTVASPQTKACAVLGLNEELFCISGLSALWVNGLVREPQRHELALLTRKRPSEELLRYRDVRDLGEIDGRTGYFAGRQCLNVLEALIQVLRNPKLTGAEVSEAVANAKANSQNLICEATERIKASARVPFTNLALDRLALADTVDVVNRIDSTNRIEYSL